MKKIEVTQPYAMSSPFAEGVYSSVSTNDFEIPANTSTAQDDTCVIDDGFLPITSTDLDDGGIAPERKNFNGMFYLSTDQRFYLQNGGFITYNSNVATAIGGYPQDAVLGFIDGQGTYKLVRSLIDDNTNDFTQDETLIDGEHWEEIAMGGGGSGYQMFDIIMKDHVLDYAETLGLAPLGTYVYKEAIAGSRYGYPDFYQKCVNQYNDGTTVNEYMSSNITVVGSLTDNEGVISGFSTSNYATVENFIGTTADTIEFVTKLNTGSTLSANTFLYAGFSIQFYNGKLNLAGTGNIGTYTYSANTDYYIKVTYSNNTIECAYSMDDINYTADGTISYTGAIQNLIYLGWGNVNNALSGSIDLNKCYININGTRWWTGINLFTYTENSNKHRFYDIADKATFDNMYAITGEAWYYGIDTTNERVFLPRSTRFKNGTTSDVGGYQAAGLPNITGAFSLNGVAQGVPYDVSGAFKDSYSPGVIGAGGGSGGDHNITVDFKASHSNSIYGASDTVEYASTKLIPYMVVGNTANESSAIDVVDVTTTENDTLPLFTGLYFDYAPNNVSWVVAGGQTTSGTIYTFAYNELVNELTTPKYNLNVIDVDDMVVGTDYSTYWKIDQTNQTFTCPIRTSERVLVAKKEATDLDPAWYNLYSDGWCEQGGSVTVNSNTWTTIYFARNFINTEYVIVGGSKVPDTSYPDHPYFAAFRNYTTSSCQTSVSDDASINKGTWTWQASGYTTIPDITDYTEPLRMYFKVANAVQNLELLNAGEVLEAVNTVSAKVDNTVHITETYENGSSGYIVYSNGYCEQWGTSVFSGVTAKQIDITFLKEFRDRDYVILPSIGADTNNNTFNFISYYNKTTTTARIVINTINGQAAQIVGCDWKASGYLAEGEY